MRILGIILALLCVQARAATITLTFTNSSGEPDTNAVRLFPISTPINVNGSYFITGQPKRVVPDASGVVTTNLLQGNWLATNQFLGQGIIFGVPSGSGSYNAAALQISGGNTFNYTPGVLQVTSTNGSLTVSSSNTNGTGTLDLSIVGSNVITFSNSATLYVDPNGNDATAKRGLRDRPWASLQQAVSNTVAGDVVKVESGTYGISNWFYVHDVEIVGAGTSTKIINWFTNAANLPIPLIELGHNVTLRNFTIDHGYNGQGYAAALGLHTNALGQGAYFTNYHSYNVRLLASDTDGFYVNATNPCAGESISMVDTNGHWDAIAIFNAAHRFDFVGCDVRITGPNHIAGQTGTANCMNLQNAPGAVIRFFNCNLQASNAASAIVSITGSAGAGVQLSGCTVTNAAGSSRSDFYVDAGATLRIGGNCVGIFPSRNSNNLDDGTIVYDPITTDTLQLGGNNDDGPGPIITHTVNGGMILTNASLAVSNANFAAGVRLGTNGNIDTTGTFSGKLNPSISNAFMVANNGRGTNTTLTNLTSIDLTATDGLDLVASYGTWSFRAFPSSHLALTNSAYNTIYEFGGGINLGSSIAQENLKLGSDGTIAANGLPMSAVALHLFGTNGSGSTIIWGDNASGLTNLNGTEIRSGTLADARLSANVPLLNGTQSFTASNNFSGLLSTNQLGVSNATYAAGVRLSTNGNVDFSGVLSGNISGATNGGGYLLTFINASSLSPGANTTNYVGADSGTSTDPGLVQADIPRGGVIKRVYGRIRVAGGVTADGGLVTNQLEIVSGGVTNLYNEIDLACLATVQAGTNTSLTTVSKGDKVSLRVRSPSSWSGPPTTCRWWWQIYIE